MNRNVSLSALDRVRTQRLVCERPEPDDLPDVLGLLCEPRVARWLWPDGQPPGEERVRAIHERNLKHWELHGFGLWLVRDRASGELVGRGGLQHTFVAGMHEVEAGWAIAPARWGSGLATEVAQAALSTGFDELGLLRVVAFTLPFNERSRRVMEKTGFRYVKDIEHVGLPHVLYTQSIQDHRRACC